MSILHRSLSLTSKVCERGSPLQQFRHITFEEGTVRAFNGLVHMQAPSALDHEEAFAVSFDRLATALRAVEGDEFEVKQKGEFLVLKKGRLTVRVRKLSTDGVYSAALKHPPKAQRTAAPGFQLALHACAPFVSADASRPWSVAALARGGYLYATNNLSLVRFPFEFPEELKIPGPAVPLLTELSSVDWISKQGNLILVGCGEALLSFPEAAGEWPKVEDFFAPMPKKLPVADGLLLEAAKTTEKFADRFVSLTDSSIEGKVATIESEYEVDLPNGKGIYNARLFSLVASVASHIDFKTYPKPVFFRATWHFGDEEGPLEGMMVGVPPERAGVTE